jgi:hypothetical protein
LCVTDVVRVFIKTKRTTGVTLCVHSCRPPTIYAAMATARAYTTWHDILPPTFIVFMGFSTGVEPV